MSEQLAASLKAACDASMPRRRLTNRKKENYWWNENIALLRKECLKARRKYQHNRTRPGHLLRRETYQQARKNLQNAISHSKSESFKKLCKEADANPWGSAYRIVMARLKGNKSSQITSSELINNIVKTLFPEGECYGEQGFPPDDVALNEIQVSETEILDLCSRIGDNKAPGLDSVPNKALKLALKAKPQMFADIFTKCLKDGTFYSEWKKQKLILIPKPGKTLGEPESYRPICLLDTIGKCLERIIYERLQKAADENGAISNRQFGFRKAKSTLDAIRLVVNTAKNAIQSKGISRKYCCIITLDIKNAFNSAGWNFILSSLRNINIPNYLITIIRDYFSSRILCYETDRGLESYTVTAGVPQGSVLGPLLWNIMYDGIFRLQLPEEATIVGFADDIAILVQARHIDDVQLYANEAIRTIKSWLESVNLKLADHKTEAVLISKKRRIETLTLQVGDSTIVSSRAIKYLGVMIDDRLNFKAHVEYSCKKATGVVTALARMMPNIGGPRQSRRVLLSRVSNSVLQYAAPIWGNLVRKTNTKKMLSLFRRSCLRVCSGFRTISLEAACVISGEIPIDIIVNELSATYNAISSNPSIARRALKRTERENSIRNWQQRWNNTKNGRWTHKLIPDISTWINRNHGEINYNLTQFLSGHGCYRSYLYRFGHDSSPKCPACPNEDETAEHVYFKCPRFTTQRRRVELCVQANLSSENVIKVMIESKENWESVRIYIDVINNLLRTEERQRNAEAIRPLSELAEVTS